MFINGDRADSLTEPRGNTWINFNAIDHPEVTVFYVSATFIPEPGPPITNSHSMPELPELKSEEDMYEEDMPEEDMPEEDDYYPPDYDYDAIKEDDSEDGPEEPVTDDDEEGLSAKDDKSDNYTPPATTEPDPPINYNPPSKEENDPEPSTKPQDNDDTSFVEDTFELK